MRPRERLLWLLGIIILTCGGPASLQAQEPPSINPFGPRTSGREDAIPGTATLSDGSTRSGQISLTRDHRLEIFDDPQQRLREIPLEAVARIEAVVFKEWLEPEWRFRENARDEKVFTGRSYPVREYVHEITLRDGRTIRGPLQAILFLQEDPNNRPIRLLLHKRDKGSVGTDLKSLPYVRTIVLGDDATPGREPR